MIYFINGWRYGREYFLSIGSFSESEMEQLLDGEIVTKNGNEFWIERSARA